MSNEAETIKNKIAESGLISIDLKDFYPEGERVVIDMKDHLFEGLILKEKDFRQYVKTEDWSKYKNKYVAITSTADAIIPTWAYMLLFESCRPMPKRWCVAPPIPWRPSFFTMLLLKNLSPNNMWISA